MLVSFQKLFLCSGEFFRAQHAQGRFDCFLVNGLRVDADDFARFELVTDAVVSEAIVNFSEDIVGPSVKVIETPVGPVSFSKSSSARMKLRNSSAQLLELEGALPTRPTD